MACAMHSSVRDVLKLEVTTCNRNIFSICLGQCESNQGCIEDFFSMRRETSRNGVLADFEVTETQFKHPNPQLSVILF